MEASGTGSFSRWGSGMSVDRSWTYSILKCMYGWSGCADSGAQQEAINRICQEIDCPHCAAAAMAAYIHDNCKGDYFMPRLDGRPNHRSVERDRAGIGHDALH